MPRTPVRRPTVHSAGAAVVLALVTVADVLFGSVILLEFAVVPPLLSAALGSRRQTIMIAGASIVTAVLLGFPDNEFATAAHAIQVAAVTIGSGFAVYASGVRNDRDARLTALALTDPLTGLVNRTVLLDRLTQLLARRDSSGVLAVMFLDLDGFKQVNDRLGHATGDALLQHVAARLGAAVRDGDTVCRFGGDEFVVLCPGLPGADEAERMAERLLEAVATPLARTGDAVAVTASIGLTLAPDAPLEAAALLKRADQAMYAAKAGGPGRQGPRGDDALRH